jgi:hypothetical protein
MYTHTHTHTHAHTCSNTVVIYTEGMLAVYLIYY